MVWAEKTRVSIQENARTKQYPKKGEQPTGRNVSVQKNTFSAENTKKKKRERNPLALMYLNFQNATAFRSFSATHSSWLREREWTKPGCFCRRCWRRWRWTLRHWKQTLPKLLSQRGRGKLLQGTKWQLWNCPLVPFEMPSKYLSIGT